MVVKDSRTTGWKCSVMERATATLVVQHCSGPEFYSGVGNQGTRVVVEKREDNLPVGMRGNTYFRFLLTFLTCQTSQ